MKIWFDSPTLSLGLCLVVFLIIAGIVEEWTHANSETFLGRLPSKINTWKKLRKEYLLTLHHTHREEGSWGKFVKIMSGKIREALVVSAHGSDDADRAVAPYHRPHRQHPDMDEVDRFMRSENDHAYLISSAGRCVPRIDDDDDAQPISKLPKSGIRARRVTDSVIPICRRRIG